MAQQQIVIGLQFQANVQQAKASLQNLQTSLNQVLKHHTLTIDGTSISKAALSAQQLQMHLKNATLDNGQLDLSKFNASLVKSNQNISQLGLNLIQAGQSGRQAFVDLASTIATAQQPVITLGTQVTKLATTFANTMRWYLSSTVLYGFIGAFQNALTYAKDLNSSLNDIRIVSSQSEEQMARFAAQANKAARALSTTTNEYAKAALIFYQQGLNDEEVLKRADITIKMANATGQTAQIVSDQLTAVWNNFYDGSKSLEYYADVMTALGAATASSTDEIATGLEKFAAIAESVGLSYEYATSALATVTATTRQSADVVGTAFKTLFARIQDLELGKSLEDGVTLGKYSQALDVIGINILDANGDLREMDSILDDLGTKWEHLTSAQKASVAQTVAGTRQYTQLIALMDNWDYFQENLQIAELSEGTLTEQANTYAESWEGASNRVAAAAEKIYGQLINDKVVIKALNLFEKLIGGIGNALESVGGLKAFMIPAFAMLGKVIISKVVPGFQMLKNSYLIATNQSHLIYENQVKLTESMINSAIATNQFTEAEQAQLQTSVTLMKSKQMLVQAQSNKYMSTEAIQQMQLENSSIEMLVNRYKELIEQKQKATQEYANLDTEITDLNSENKYLNRRQNKILQSEDFRLGEKIISEQYKSLQGEEQIKFRDEYYNIGNNGELNMKSEKIAEVVGGDLGQEYLQNSTKIAQNEEKITALKTKQKPIDKEILDIQTKQKNTSEQITAAQKRMFDLLNKPPVTLQNMGQQAMGLVSNLSMAVSGASMLISTLSNPDTSGFEKFTSILMSIGFMLPAIVSGYQQFSVILTGINQAHAAGIALKSTLAGVDAAEIATTEMKLNKFKELILIKQLEQSLDEQEYFSDSKEIIMQQIKNGLINKETGEIKENAAAIIANQAVSEGKIAVDQKENFVTQLSILFKGAETKANDANSAAILRNKLVRLGWIAVALAAVAAIVAIGVAIHKATDAEYQQQKAMERVSKNVQQAKSEYERLKGILTELETTFENFKETNTYLDSMIQGTTDWNEKLVESNELALDLIKKFNDIDYTIQNGRIVIEEQELERIQNQANQQTLQAQARYLFAQSNYRSQELEGTIMSQVKTINQEQAYDTYLDFLDEFHREKNKMDRAYVVVDELERTVDSYDEEEFDRLYNNATKKYNKAKQEFESGYFEGREGRSGFKYVEFNTGLPAGSLTDQQYKDLIQHIEKNGYFEDSEELVQTLSYLGVTDALTVATIEDNIAAIYTNTQSNLKVAYANAKLEMAARELLLTETIKDDDTRAIVAALQTRSAQSYEGLSSKGVSGVQAQFGSLKNFQAALRIMTGIENLNIGDWNGEHFSAAYYNDDNTKVYYGTTDGNRSSKNGDLSYAEYTRMLYEDMITNPEKYEEVIAYMQQDQSRTDEDDLVLKAIEQTREIINTTGPELVQQLSNANITNIQDIAQAIGSNQEQIDLALLGFSREEVKAIDTSKIGDEKLREQLDNAKENYEFQRQIANLSASENWFKEKEERESEELSNILTDADMDQIDFESYVKQVKSLNKELGLTDEQYKDLAKRNLQVSNGLNKVSEVIEENKEALNAGAKAGAAYRTAINDVKDAVNEWMGVEFTDDEIIQLYSTIESAIDGNTEALKRLQLEAAKKIVVDMDIDTEKFDNEKTALDDLIAYVGSNNIEVGMDVNIGPAIEGMNKMLAAGEITAAQAQAYWDKVGFNPEVTTTEVTPDKPTVTYTTSELGTGIGDDFKPLGRGGGFTSKNTSYTTIQVPQFSGDGKNKVKYTPGAKTTTPKAAKSSSGGGGSSNRPDRYRVQSETNEALQKQYDSIAAARDRAFGSDAVAEIDKLIAKEQELLALDQEWLALAEKNAKENRAKLEAAGVVFNENNVAINEEDFKDNEEVADLLEDYKEDLEYIDETQESIYEHGQNIESSFLEQVEIIHDLNLEASEFSRTLMNWKKSLRELTDVEYDWATDFEDNMNSIKLAIRDTESYAVSLYNALINMTTLDEKGNVISLFTQEEVEKMTSGEIPVDFSRMSKQQLDAIQPYIEGRLNSVTQAFESWNANYDGIQTILDDINEDIENNMEKFEQANAELDYYENLIDVIGKGSLGVTNEMIDTLQKTRAQVAELEVASAKEAVDAAENELKLLNDELDDARAKGDEVGVKRLTEMIEETEETLYDAEERLRDSITTSLEMIVEAFETNIERAIDSFAEQMYGMSFDEFDEQYDRVSEQRKRYLEDYQKIYELSKLTRNINNSIDNTDNVKAKQMLRDLEEEIAYYQESGREMSQYELENLQRKYDLRLAQIALEEAQNAKNTVRLTRDSEGNYSYTYVADQDNINDAEQKVEDAMYAMQEASTNYIYEMEEQLVELNRRFAEDIKEIMLDNTLTEEERNKKIEELTEYYNGLREYYGEEMQKAIDSNQILYTKDWQSYSEATGYKISADKDFIDSFGETTLAVSTGTTTVQGYMQQMNAAIGTFGEEGSGYLGTLYSAFTTMSNEINTILTAGGIPDGIDGFKKKFSDAVGDENTEGSIVKKSKKAKQAITDAANAVLDEETGLAAALQAIQDKRVETVNSLDEIKNAAQLLADAYEDARLKLVDLHKEQGKTPATPSGTTTGGNTTGGGNGDGDGDKDKTIPIVGPPETKIAYWRARGGVIRGDSEQDVLEKLNTYFGNMIVKSYNSSGRGTLYQVKSPQDQREEEVMYLSEKKHTKQAAINEAIEKYGFVEPVYKFDTGGYTGAWGTDGRLAMLHQKELVLNAADTENLLTAVDILREVVRSIDLNAKLAEASSLVAFGAVGATNTVDQNVHISATFPNVTDHNEIEQALSNLVNEASQYAFRR